jgi:DNA recombination protein RmuC
MIDNLLIILFVAVLVAIILLVILLLRSGASRPSEERIKALGDALERLDRGLRDEIGRNRVEAGTTARQDREEIAGSLRSLSDSLGGSVLEIARLQKDQLDSFGTQLAGLSQTLDARVEAVRTTIEQRLQTLQEDNSSKLEAMRSTVDEKLQSTLETRLGQSFRQVSEQLDRVAQGLGEMQTLASGVGDLKKVLTNIKTRGTWGEVQLGTLLDQILTPDQYSRNVATKAGSSDRVEFAIRLPGRSLDDHEPVWLPVDAKFPLNDYQRLLDAQDQANASMVEEAGRMLESRIKLEAKSIREKYLDPPRTTDFALMFLPTEGLFAEVIRRSGLCDTLQREYRVTIAGPMTLTAILNSLQMGFRTLAIERRSSEVWALLAAVKTEFGRFGEILDKTKKKLEEASSSIDSAATRTRQIERKLKAVQTLPAEQTSGLLEEPGGTPGRLEDV